MAEIDKKGSAAIAMLYCESGRRVGIAESILRQAVLGNIRHLEGDMAAWRQSGLPVEK